MNSEQSKFDADEKSLWNWKRLLSRQKGPNKLL